ncbi:MAG: Rrf2 family transcriptional regulator [Terrisporobacter othiniensis]|uniref:Rrf2 family transcriptional regulator n=2 Tax=Terrisporobacter TaxID=1505652 RepID=A0AAX2ZDK7_9FIRM|nr:MULTISPECIES: Rrf2 family transcriptional regulator [Terrisporobacter]MBN9646403.1 Rrf2 family transcriptional regulator [Terrisporobacter glycolicus]MDU4859648.1 Rrf2 family transcriptional regulator [Terrisporobacter othiniensis]MDU6994183.1 Rrf2 family transcriptional regulator [Terrisporobacter othiniensis]UEL46931.1 Rrf2 family transcriptional regulator [Terrisporobacter hibernicus]UPA29443.1 Rrf2 family transcriptional regulator [Terrisporobacter glycolicus]
MKLSTKGKYGLKAIFELSLHVNEGPMPLNMIASKQKIPEQYLEQIFSTLKKSKLITSVRGAQGGYLLNKAPNEVTVGDVLAILEGPVALSQCIIDEGVCENSNDCSTKLVWEKLKKGIEDVLNSITLQDMVDDYNKKNNIKEFDITELMNNKK